MQGWRPRKKWVNLLLRRIKEEGKQLGKEKGIHKETDREWFSITDNTTANPVYIDNENDCQRERYYRCGIVSFLRSICAFLLSVCTWLCPGVHQCIGWMCYVIPLGTKCLYLKSTSPTPGVWKWNHLGWKPVNSRSGVSNIQPGGGNWPTQVHLNVQEMSQHFRRYHLIFKRYRCAARPCVVLQCKQLVH